MASSSDICAFTLLIVYGVDIVEHIVETASPSKIDLRDKDKTERFWNHVSRKNYYLGWIILLSLVALQFKGGQITTHVQWRLDAGHIHAHHAHENLAR